MIDPLSKRSCVQLASPIDLQVLFARWDYEPEKIEVHGPRSGLLVEHIGLKVWGAGSPDKNNPTIHVGW